MSFWVQPEVEDKDADLGNIAVITMQPGEHGNGWAIYPTVRVHRIKDACLADQLAAGCRENGMQVAVVPWNSALAPSIDNNGARRALGLPIRFFRCSDDGAEWTVVAVDMDHAKVLMRRQGAEFGQWGDEYDTAMEKGLLIWTEIDDGKAASIRCHTDDGQVMLRDCDIGSIFCSEW